MTRLPTTTIAKMTPGIETDRPPYADAAVS